VTSAAQELSTLSLADALSVLLVYARSSPEQFQRACVRWSARYLSEVRPAPNSEEARLVLDAAAALGGDFAEAGVDTLHVLCERRGLRELVRALDEWQVPDG
jgi:hypothetical protein